MAMLGSVYLNVNNQNVNFLLLSLWKCFWDSVKTGIITIVASPFSIDVNVLMWNIEGKWRGLALLKTQVHGN